MQLAILCKNNIFHFLKRLLMLKLSYRLSRLETDNLYPLKTLGQLFLKCVNESLGFASCAKHCLN